MNLTIFETTIHGHRGAYLVEITTAAVRRGWNVTVLTPSHERERNSPYFDQIKDLVGASNLVFSPYWVDMPESVSALSMLRYQFTQWHSVRNSLKLANRPCDFVYAPNIDYMDKAIQVLGAPSRPVPMGGMVMRVRFHLGMIGLPTHRRMPESLGALSLSNLLGKASLKVVTTADPSLADYCKGKAAPRYRKMVYVPEIGMTPPSCGTNEAKAAFGFSPADKVILIYGSIDERKAFGSLIDAVAGCALAERLRILVVGKPDEASRTALDGARYQQQREQGILVTRLAHADARLQELAFAAADVVWVAYRNHSTMSGVFSQAMSCSLPVIGPDYGLLSWLVTKNKVGICVNIDDPEDIRVRVVGLLRDAGALDGYRRSAARLSLAHLPERFGAAVCDAIALGRGKA
ncbi:MAG: glycosyltransferase [Steroidobacteraceae bacterium]